MHKYVTCPVLYFLFFFSLSTLSTLENWAGCAKASVCISRRPAFPTTQLSSPSMLRVYWSKQNESQDGHIEVSCDWLRWYSTESELLSKMTILSFFFFFVWTWCIVVPLFIPPRPSGGGSQGCEEQDGVENLFLSLQWERENETEREKVLPSVLPSAFFPPTPPRPRPRGCCNADRWARGERRGGFNWSGISGDQSVYWSVIRSSEWVQPLLSPTPPTSPPHHISTHIRAAGPADRGAPPWPSTVRGWCSSGTDAGHLHVQKEGVSLGQSRRGPWSLEGGPVQGNGVLIPGNKMTERRRFYNYITIF